MSLGCTDTAQTVNNMQESLQDIFPTYLVGVCISWHVHDCLNNFGFSYKLLQYSFFWEFFHVIFTTNFLQMSKFTND